MTMSVPNRAHSSLGGASITIGSVGTKPGVVHRFVTTIERTGVNTVQIETTWGVNGSFLVADASGDESALFEGKTPIFEHPTGHFTSFNSFGFRLEANDPFSESTTSGRNRISNLKIESYKRQDLEIVNVTKKTDNTVTLNWNSQPDAYAGYDVVYNLYGMSQFANGKPLGNIWLRRNKKRSSRPKLQKA